MPRDGSGNYTIPEAAFVSGTTINEAEVNNNFADIASALTASVAKDGQTTMTGALKMGANKVTGVAAGAAATDAATIGGAETLTNKTLTSPTVNTPTITTPAITGTITQTSTTADATQGPTLDIYRNSASPADNDLLGEVQFNGENDAAEKIKYAAVDAAIDDATDGTEDGSLRLAVMRAGSAVDVVEIKDGVTLNGATGGDQGDGTINAQGVYVNGVSLATGSLPRSYLAGLALTNGTDADHDIDIAAGECRDAADAADIALSAITKRLDATWASGTGNGGLSSSLTAPANNTWYHVHAIIVGGSADVGFDTSVTAANLVADHSATAYRRIGSVLTDGTANIIGFSQNGDEFLWDVPVSDVDATNPGTTAQTSALTVPSGVKVNALGAIEVEEGASSQALYALVTSLDQTDTAPSSTLFTVAHRGDVAQNVDIGSTLNVRTNTSRQIRYRISYSDATTRVLLATSGWVDRRGRDA